MESGEFAFFYDFEPRISLPETNLKKGTWCAYAINLEMFAIFAHTTTCD